MPPLQGTWSPPCSCSCLKLGTSQLRPWIASAEPASAPPRLCPLDRGGAPWWDSNMPSLRADTCLALMEDRSIQHRPGLMGPVNNFFWIFLPGPFCASQLLLCVETHLPGHTQCTNCWWAGGQAGRWAGGQASVSTEGGCKPDDQTTRWKGPFLPKESAFSNNRGLLQILCSSPHPLLKQCIPSGPQRNDTWAYFPSKFRNC